MESKLVTLTLSNLAFTEAMSVSDEIEEISGGSFAFALNETDDAAGRSNVVIYCGNRRMAGELRQRLLSSGHDAGSLAAAVLPDVDWVRSSLEGLPPVVAGRFFLYGAHDRARRRTGGIS